MLRFLNFLEEQEKFDTTLQYHDKLNPVLWKNEQLNSDVKKALLRIAHDWGKFSKIPDKAIKDIIILGGNCNYNYTSLSDIDLHLVVDMKKIIKDEEILNDWLYDKKVLWAKYHPNIRIKGYPVEMYAQDENQSHKKGQGVYSLQSNSWLVKPVYHKGVEDLYTDPHLINKIKFYIKHIDNLTSDAAYPTKEKAEEIRKLKTKFQQLRNASIQKAGEFSRENLLYKALRNMGKLDKMSQYISNYEDKQYSLAEQKNKDVK